MVISGKKWKMCKHPKSYRTPEFIKKKDGKEIWGYLCMKCGKNVKKDYFGWTDKNESEG